MKKLLTVFFFLTSFANAQWKISDQPEGAYIYSIDSGFKDTNKIVVSTDRDFEYQIWYSSNGGNSWVDISDKDFIGEWGISKIDANDNLVYHTSYGFLRATSDLGQSWYTLYNGTGYVNDVVYKPDNPSELLVVDCDGVSRSTDFGNSWTRTLTLNACGSSSLNYSMVNHNNVLLESSSSGFFISKDAGVTWDSVIFPTPYSSGHIVFDPINDSTLYSQYYIPDSTAIQKSTNFGSTWQIIPGSISYDFDVCYGENNNVIFLAAGSGGIFKSSDLGVNWTHISPLTCYTIFPNGEKVYAGFPSSGFAEYLGDSTWKFMNNNLKAVSMECIFFNDSTRYAASYNNFYHKKNSSVEWQPTYPDWGAIHISFYDQNVGFASRIRGANSILKTTNRGLSWSPFPGISSTYDILDIQIIGNYIYAAVDDYNSGGIYRSPVDFPSWTGKLDGYNSKIMFDGQYLYGFHRSNPKMLVRSSDYGNSWDYVGELAGGIDYHAFAKKDIPKGILIGGFKKDYPPLNCPGVLYFVNGTTIINLMQDTSIYSIAAPADRKEFFVMTYAQSKILKADSIKGSFYEVENGLPYLPVGQGGYSLFYFNTPGYQNRLFTNRGGIMEMELDGITSSNEMPERSVAYSLEQNYPNPFNPTTIINYSIPNEGVVTLKLFDILGKEVKVLINDYKPAGKHKYELNASMLPSGVYLYRLTSGSYNAVRKLIILK